MSDEPKPPEKPPFPRVPAGFTGSVGHMLARIPCPHCGAPAEEHRLENYDEMWRDGDVMCNRCGKRVRTYDAG